MEGEEGGEFGVVEVKQSHDTRTKGSVAEKKKKMQQIVAANKVTPNRLISSQLNTRQGPGNVLEETVIMTVTVVSTVIMAKTQCKFHFISNIP